MEYKVGDTISYETWGGVLRTGVVTGKYADVKNGLPGFDMTTASGSTVWGYDEQIANVLARA
jgi:hypothetical protein